jgi:hypothetical protein
MYTALFLFQSLLQLLLLVWLVRIWKRTGLAVAAAMFIPQFGLFYDNGMVGIGSFVGIGETLEALSWPRFWIHWLFGTWLIILCGAVLRLAQFEWAQPRWVMGAFCALTAALMAYDLPHFWRESLYPVCELGLERYSTTVGPDRFCFPDQVATPRSAPPWPSIITCLVVIATGAILWIRRGFPWMCLGGSLMLISALPPFMKLKLDNFGEVLIAGGCIWALAHFSAGVVAPARVAQRAAR